MKRLDPEAAERIRDYLETRIAGSDDPRLHGSALKGRFQALWRYRVGDYRIVCEIQDERCVVLTIRIGHRREVYR